MPVRENVFADRSRAKAVTRDWPKVRHDGCLNMTSVEPCEEAAVNQRCMSREGSFLGLIIVAKWSRSSHETAILSWLGCSGYRFGPANRGPG